MTVLITTRQMIFQISMAWVKWPGTSFLQSINQDKTYSLLIEITEPLNNKLYLNLLQKFKKSEALPKMTS